MAISFSRESSQPRDRTRVSRIVGSCFYRLSHQGNRNSIHDDCPQNSPPNEDAPPVSCSIAKSTRPRADCCRKEVESEAIEGVSWAQRLKRLPAMRETWVRSLGWEDPLEKEMATHSSTLAWKIPWIEQPGGLQFTGSAESNKTERFHFHFHLTKVLSFLVCSFTHWANQKKKFFFLRFLGCGPFF